MVGAVLRYSVELLLLRYESLRWIDGVLISLLRLYWSDSSSIIKLLLLVLLFLLINLVHGGLDELRILSSELH